MKKIVDHQIVRVKRAAEHLATGSLWPSAQPMPPGIILTQVYTHVITDIKNPGTNSHGPVQIGDTIYIFYVPVEIPRGDATFRDILNMGRYQVVNDKINDYVEPCTKREEFLFHVASGTPNRPVILKENEDVVGIRWFRYKDRTYTANVMSLDWWGGFNNGNEYVI